MTTKPNAANRPHRIAHNRAVLPADEVLAQQYVELGSLSDVARLYGVNGATIRSRIARLVRIKPQSEVIKGRRRANLPDDSTLAAMYNSGRSITSIAKEFGVDNTTVRVRLADNVTIRNAGFYAAGRPSAIRKNLPCSEIVELYRSGISEQEIAKRYNTSRPSIRRRLKESGVPVRSYSASQRMRNRINPSRAFIRAAHIAGHGSESEDIAAGIIGRTYSRQYVVDPYHLDFADCSSRIAIELCRYAPSTFNPRREGTDRLEHILNHGWFVLYIIDRSRKFMFDYSEQVVSFLDTLRNNNPPCGEYGVVWRNVQPTTRLKYEFYKPPFIEHTACG